MNFKNLVISILGSYQALVDSQGNIVTGVAGIDYAYICGCVLFCITLYSLFRILGLILGGVK